MARSRAAVEAAVTDTHPLLLHAAGAKLGRQAAQVFERGEGRAALVYVPTPVLWECALLARAGRVNLRRSLEAFCDDLFSNPAYQPVDLTPAHILRADQLRFTRDPFDGLIVATAQVLGLPLVTRDSEIQESGLVATIW